MTPRVSSPPDANHREMLGQLDSLEKKIAELLQEIRQNAKELEQLAERR